MGSESGPGFVEVAATWRTTQQTRRPWGAAVRAYPLTHSAVTFAPAKPPSFAIAKGKRPCAGSPGRASPVVPAGDPIGAGGATTMRSAPVKATLGACNTTTRADLGRVVVQAVQASRESLAGALQGKSSKQPAQPAQIIFHLGFYCALPGGGLR